MRPTGDAAATPATIAADAGASSLRRGSNALILNMAGTGLLGAAFWMVAARLTSPAVIGEDGVLINTIMAIGTLACLNLPTLLTVLAPRASNADSLILDA